MLPVKKVFAFVLACVCCLLVCCEGLAADYPMENAVVVKEARIRKEPAQNSKKVATLKKNTVVTVTGEAEGKDGELWYSVETKNGKSGYIRSDFVELPKEEVVFTGPSVTKEMTVEVTAKCKSKNHVGSSWSKKCYFNDEELSEDKDNLSVVSVTSGEKITVTSKLTEHDRNPDVGKNTVEYIPTNTDLEEGFEITHEVRVKENSGKYKGYAAVWSVTYTFSSIDDSEE